ncbi:MAG: helix-hairpin-helix domain-containing protein [Myxococcota bacterium]|nr:DNA-binding protein [Myxococcales bacterium]
MSASAGAQATPSRGRSGEQPSPPRASQRATKASQAASGPRRPGRAPGNDEIASVLERVADLLEVQHASAYRVRAYRAGARTIRGLPFPVAERVEERGDASLESLPAIGRSLAALVREYVATSRLGLLERLEGETSPHDLFATVPGIGPALADRIESQLHVETLEDLEAAAHDGRLESVPGFGARRVRAVRDSLASGLRYSAARRARAGPPPPAATERPSVGLLLEIDRLYRERAARGELRRITPRRFNPEHRAWLPVLHEDREGWSLSALFSNTARAHELGRTDDWVVVYYERNGDEGQATVVTEPSGPLAGRRVVRGREAECARLDEAKRAPTRSTARRDASGTPRSRDRKKTEDR